MRLLLLILAPLLLRAEECCALGGTVVNSVTKEPVARALVFARQVGGGAGVTTTGSGGAQEARRALGISAITDSTGHFAFSALAPGRYNLSAERGGFVTSNYGARGTGRTPAGIELSAGHEVHDLVVPIIPQGVIAGRVLDEEGEPAAGIQVQVSTKGYQNGRRQLNRVTTAATNDLGEYRAWGLAPGKYYVGTVSAGNLFASLTAQKPAEEDYVPVYYPRTADPAAAAPVTVGPGAQVREIDLRLAKARIVSVRGRVVTEGLPPGTRVSAMLVPWDPAMSSLTRAGIVAGDGAFEIRGVSPGTYTLMASTNLRGKSLGVRVPVTVGSSDMEGVQATLRAGMAVEGRVRIEDADHEGFAGWQVGLQPAETGGMMFGLVGGARLSERGTFRLEDVGAEPYTVWVSGMPEGYYVASIRSGGVDALVKGLDTTAGAPPPVEIVVRPNAGQVGGTVSDESSHQPAAAATVVLVPEDAERRGRPLFYRSAAAAGDGRFTLKNLNPGDYRIYAFEEIEFSAWLDPEYMKPFEGRGEKITVREGAPQTVRITLIPGEIR